MADTEDLNSLSIADVVKLIYLNGAGSGGGGGSQENPSIIQSAAGSGTTLRSGSSTDDWEKVGDDPTTPRKIYITLTAQTGEVYIVRTPAGSSAPVDPAPLGYLLPQGGLLGEADPTTDIFWFYSIGSERQVDYTNVFTAE